MAGLSPPPPRDQVKALDADRFELCGEACLASVFELDIETVSNWLRQHEGGEPAVHTGTGTKVLIDFCSSRGAGAQVVRGPATQYVARAVARGHYALVLIWGDHRGNPMPRAQSLRLHSGGIGHWLLGYGASAATVQVMQPWGGRLVRYDLSGGKDQQLGIEIDRAVAGPGPARRRTKGRIYIVKRGDTLSGIAAAQHVTPQALLRANPEIRSPNLIIVGKRITIPG